MSKHNHLYIRGHPIRRREKRPKHRPAEIDRAVLEDEPDDEPQPGRNPMSDKLADLHTAEQLAWQAVSQAKDHSARCYREETAARLKSRLASERVETLEIEAEVATVARESVEISLARREGVA